MRTHTYFETNATFGKPNENMKLKCPLTSLCNQMVSQSIYIIKIMVK